jgi:hypothetical protein
MLVEGVIRPELIRPGFKRALLVDFPGAGSLQTQVFSGCENLTTLSQSLSLREIAWMT